MNHVSKLLLVTATAAVVASAGTVIAYASWPVPSRTVKVKVHSVEMPRGVQPSVARSGANAVVTWSPQEIGPGTTMQSYLVRRHSVDAAAVKEFAPVAATTFTDTAVPTGKWYWTVTPKFAGWIGAESRKSANLKFTAAVAAEPPALVANTSVAQPPETAPANPAGGDPVTSPPPPQGGAAPPAVADPEQDETDVPPPVTEQSAPAEPAPPSTGPAGDSE